MCYNLKVDPEAHFSVPAWIASDMAVPALHDRWKRYPGTHWTLQVRLQVLWQHEVGVFPILKSGWRQYVYKE